MKSLGALAQQRNKLAGDGSYIYLLFVQARSLTDPEGTEAFRLASTVEDVVWGEDADGTPLVWSAYPFRVGTVTEEGEGSLPQIQVTIANVGAEVLRALFEREFLDDERVMVHVVHEATLNDPSASLTLDGKVGDVQVDERAIQFTIGAEDLYSRQLPGVTITEDGCEHVYGGELCKFPIAELDPGQAQLGPCPKTLAACRLRGSLAQSQGYEPVLWPRQFGGFPGALS